MKDFIGEGWGESMDRIMTKTLRVMVVLLAIVLLTSLALICLP